MLLGKEADQIKIAGKLIRPDDRNPSLSLLSLRHEDVNVTKLPLLVNFSKLRSGAPYSLRLNLANHALKFLISSSFIPAFDSVCTFADQNPSREFAWILSNQLTEKPFFAYNHYQREVVGYKQTYEDQNYLLVINAIKEGNLITSNIEAIKIFTQNSAHCVGILSILDYGFTSTNEKLHDAEIPHFSLTSYGHILNHPSLKECIPDEDIRKLIRTSYRRRNRRFKYIHS